MKESLNSDSSAVYFFLSIVDLVSSVQCHSSSFFPLLMVADIVSVMRETLESIKHFCLLAREYLGKAENVKDQKTTYML